ncbi:AlkZ-related protein [Paenibacillus flagellatus]|uniref:Uncharacterized protein n=1 Tax=Paenibacillus flagellatus TaxID=2211139 RepID=A0A2V5KFL3_9BACL|nr:hypothetical protein [Paenibacillus flagellatus]PYI52870.1 hypothetical protein DLM86_17830 [Paenibacillus flagellatus]
MEPERIRSFEQAGDLVRRCGILPLSGFIPDHPSLDAATEPSAWHTGTEADPWLWRVRLAREGVAAYGRFVAKKPAFLAAELFPLFARAVAPAKPVERRYADGELSRAAWRVYEAIEAEPGIEARALRRSAGMTAKTDKCEFDKALIELQESFDIVIRGTEEVRGEQGGKTGWNGTCYTPASQWMAEHGLPECGTLSREDAAASLLARLEPMASGKALAFLRNKWGL